MICISWINYIISWGFFFLDIWVEVGDLFLILHNSMITDLGLNSILSERFCVSGYFLL